MMALSLLRDGAGVQRPPPHGPDRHAVRSRVRSHPSRRRGREMLCTVTTAREVSDGKTAEKGNKAGMDRPIQRAGWATHSSHACNASYMNFMNFSLASSITWAVIS